MADSFKVRTMKRKNVKGLALTAPAPKVVNPSDGDSQIPGAVGNRNSTRTDTLEIGVEFRLDLKSEDLIVLKELGAGNGGTVSKVMHAGTKVVMARKIIRVDAKENVRKQIVRELQVGHDCNNCPNIVTFYGAFQNEARDIVMCMEYMDSGSLDSVSKNFGPVRVDVLGKIAEAILGGLVYLYEAHRIMHRDIKPSNVLLNSRGQIKLCDFGVATETVNSLANTFVGTSTYMAPERIQGGVYSVKSDVWSVGLTIMELAVGRFPFDSSESAAGDRASAGPMGILDLLQTIVHEPAPKLPRSDAFPPILDDFVAKCLLKKPDERPTPRELYDNDAFLQAAKRTPVNLEDWAISMMERHNRKSYLAPPAPKSIDKSGHDLSARSPIEPVTSARARQTPTSGEIPLNISTTPSTTITTPQIPSSSTTPRQVSMRTPVSAQTHIHTNGSSTSNSSQPNSARSNSGYPIPHRPSGHTASQQSQSTNHHPSYPSRDPRVNFPNPNDRRVNRSPHNSDTSAVSTPRSLSLEHLSLEDGPYERPTSAGPRPIQRQPYPNEPVSAVEAGPRPFFPPRTSSSSAVNARSNPPPLSNMTPLNIRAAPPPSGPLPPPPMGNSTTPRRPPNFIR